jgi:hypothetical protein
MLPDTTLSNPAAAGPWDTLYPAGQSMTAIGNPKVETIGSLKWEKNTRSENPGIYDGYRFATYTDPIPVNGATAVAVVNPTRTTLSDGWTSVIDVFYNRLVLGVRNDTGEVENLA